MNDQPNPAAIYFDARRRKERIAERTLRKPKPYLRPGAARVERTPVPKSSWRTAATIASAQVMSELNGRVYEAGKLEARARTFVNARYVSPAWAVRGVFDKDAWRKAQEIKSSIYHAIIMMVTTGAKARQALALHWDRARLGPPPSVDELERMAADFQRSL